MKVIWHIANDSIIDEAKNSKNSQILNFNEGHPLF